MYISFKLFKNIGWGEWFGGVLVKNCEHLWKFKNSFPDFKTNPSNTKSIQSSKPIRFMGSIQIIENDIKSYTTQAKSYCSFMLMDLLGLQRCNRCSFSCWVRIWGKNHPRNSTRIYKWRSTLFLFVFKLLKFYIVLDSTRWH